MVFNADVSIGSKGELFQDQFFRLVESGLRYYFRTMNGGKDL